jgi:outer membrane lipoprotein-sorting protein
MKRSLILLYAVLFVLGCSFSALADDKLSAEEIIAKHLDSIGSKAKRDEVKNRMIVGVSNFAVLRTPSNMAGQAVLASEANKTLLGINFGSPAYPFEKIIFNGDKASIAFVTPGNRSALGTFLLVNKVIITEGLLGGTLQSAWSLQDLKGRKAKVENAGTKKIDGRECYVLNYFPNGGSNLTVKLFFDAENFQHLRTEYRQYIGAQQGAASSRTGIDEAINNSAKQQETRHTLIEEYSAYKPESGLVLPHTYKLYLSLEETRGTKEFEWKFEFSQFVFNQKFDPKSFEAESE